MRAEIRNLAEIGYVSTQETVALVRELQAGYRPDVVLFYDGVNDTTSALLEGRPTLSTNEINRVREFNLLQSPGRLTAALAWNLVKDSGSFRLAQSLSRRFGRGPAVAYPSRSERELELLANGVVQGYLGNVRLVEAWDASTGSSRSSSGNRSSSRSRNGLRSKKRKPRSTAGPGNCSARCRRGSLGVTS